MKKGILLAILTITTLIFSGCGHALLNQPSHHIVHTGGVVVETIQPEKRVYVIEEPAYIQSTHYVPSKYKNVYQTETVITPYYNTRYYINEYPSNYILVK
jgi:hypothetical protein